jgi:hypothetical protein
MRYRSDAVRTWIDYIGNEIARKLTDPLGIYRRRQQPALNEGLASGLIGERLLSFAYELFRIGVAPNTPTG